MKKQKLILFCCLIWLLTSCQGRIVLEAPKIDIDPSIVATVSDNTDARQRSNLHNDQWNMTAIGADQIWKDYQGSRTIRLMLIGTGVNYNHPDLKNNIHINHEEYDVVNAETGLRTNGVDDDGNGLVDDFIGYDYIDEDGLAFDHFGYDTYAAGVIGADHENNLGIKGILKRVTIYPVRYIDSDGMSNIPNLVLALKHVLLVEDEPHVVLLNLLNLKLAEDSETSAAETEMLRSLLTRINARGIPLVIGAGNNPTSMEFTGGNNLIQLFHDYDNVLIVSSTNNESELAPLAYFNSFFVDLFAPGHNIPSTAPNGKWENISGTMIAAAHVAGALALAKSVYQGGFEQLRVTLLSDTGSSRFDNVAARTRYNNKKQLNVKKLLEALQD